MCSSTSKAPRVPRNLLLNAVAAEAPTWRRAVAAGVAMALSTIGLAGTSAWLIVRSAQHPAILTLTLPMGLVQFFALAKASARYAERVTTHEAALRAMGRVRAGLAAAMAPLFPVGLGPRSGEVVDAALRDVECVQDLLVTVAGPLLTSVAAGLVTVVVDGALVPWAGLSLLVALVLAAVVVPWGAQRLGRRTQGSLLTTRAAMSQFWSDAVRAGDELVFGGGAEHLRTRLEELEQRYDLLRRRHALLVGATQATGVLLSGVAVVAAVVATAQQLRAGHLANALVAVPALLAVAALELVNGVTPTLVGLRGDLAAAARVVNLTTLEPVVHEPAVPRLLHDGPLTMAQVSQVFGVAEVLRDVDLEVASGDVLLLEGPSGSGKSTIGLLAAKFMDSSGGVVARGEADYRTVTASQVRAVVGHVDDTPHVFATTLAGNLRIASPDATDEELCAALVAAGLGSFLASRPLGLATQLGGATTGLSGGEQRRLGVARALLVRHDVTFLDEPTEGLDEASAEELWRGLLAHVAGRALVVISHREADRAHATRRVRCDQGRVLETAEENHVE
jgi:thiol reductant ABC exporter CydC subunit